VVTAYFKLERMSGLGAERPRKVRVQFNSQPDHSVEQFKIIHKVP
jgi:hypothetical protein